MSDFAKASRLLLQPLSEPDSAEQFLDPSHPQPQEDQKPQDFDIMKDSTDEPSTSPYGDIHRWDLLWLGHCGTVFPHASDQKVPIGRAVIHDDETVPEHQHVEMQFGNSELVDTYPHHTRVVSRAWATTCTLGYGISLPGARRALYELGLNKMDGPTDIMYRSICQGTEGRATRTCLSVQPQLFQHYRAAGSKSSYSDINDNADELNEQGFTRNVRWSTRINLPKLVDGSTDYIDQFKDGEAANPNLGWK